jgi:methionine salvage enolase-phosphatase E1
MLIIAIIGWFFAGYFSICYFYKKGSKLSHSNIIKKITHRKATIVDLGDVIDLNS